MAGSPPLVRERLYVLYRLFYQIRITPARAGKTFHLVFQVLLYQDHPRSCGKDPNNPRFLLFRPGSPPLVRERQLMSCWSGVTAGITPARAGKTFCYNIIKIRSRDHPRSCGKDVNQICKIFDRSGSPPLVRERHRSPHLIATMMGITPARAGKTRPQLSLCKWR